MATRMFEEKELATRYVIYRPTYSEDVYTTILKFYEDGKGLTCNYDLAVDVGCGSGQNTRPLCKVFRHVIGCDVSEEQINAAKKDLPNLSYKVCPGEKLAFLESGSADLVTIAAALHWLDTDAFFKEATRVLKPGGVLAAYSYLSEKDQFLVDDDANDIMIQFYRNLPQNKIRLNFHSQIEAKYNYRFPFEDQLRIDLEKMCVNTEMSVDEYIGFMTTRSVMDQHFKDNPGATDLVDLKKTLEDFYGDRTMRMKWPGCMVLCRKPK